MTLHRKTIKSKHTTDWRTTFRSECLARVQKDRESLFEKLRNERIGKEDLKADLEIIAQDISKKCLRRSWTPTELSLEEYTAILLEMQEALFEETAKDDTGRHVLELEALSGEELDEVLDKFASFNPLSAASENGSEIVPCPICKKANLKETLGGVLCPVEGRRIALANFNEPNPLLVMKNLLANALNEHNNRGCSAVPLFSCGPDLQDNVSLFLVCDICGSVDLVV